jgi:hypothetical protein
MGMTVTKNDLLCAPSTFAQPKRPHRRRRIQKKWIKRYGYLMTQCSGRDERGLRAYQMAGIGIVACPHAFDLITKAATPPNSQENP